MSIDDVSQKVGNAISTEKEDVSKDGNDKLLVNKLEAKERESKFNREQSVLNHYNRILISLSYIAFSIFLIFAIIYIVHISLPENLRWLDRESGLEKIELIFITTFVNVLITVLLQKLKKI